MIIERDGRGERAYDIWSLLLKKRIVFLGTAIDDAVSNLVVAQLLYLQSEDAKTPIEMYINSPGGSVSSGLAIYDTMKFIDAPVHTVCIGLAASMGAILLAAGEKGRRTALPHARIMIHQPWAGGIQGQATDIAIQAEEILKTRNRLNELIASDTGRELDDITRDTDRDKFFSADEAREYGIIDAVTTRQTAKITP
jgi:ATP-dependent Clp protease protease subunit